MNRFSQFENLGRGIIAQAHAAPIHCLDMHRPERLHRAAIHVGAGAITGMHALAALLFALFLVQFPEAFRVLADFFLVHEPLQPVRKPRPRQTVLVAVDALREATPTPRLDVYRPESSMGFAVIT
nr:hypothetical protein [Magnetospirillum molischianum]